VKEHGIIGTNFWGEKKLKSSPETGITKIVSNKTKDICPKTG
jgi:hypothetical protein